MAPQIPPRDESGEYRAPINSIAAKLALGEPSGPPTIPAGSLLETYQRWRDQQVAKAALAPKGAPWPTPAEIEANALAKSRKRIAKAQRAGKTPAMALATAFKKYRKLGGKSSLATWHRAVTS